MTGRLLNVDVDVWVHLNCALWSSDAGFSKNGMLSDMQRVVTDSQSIHCSICGVTGASVICIRVQLHI